MTVPSILVDWARLTRWRHWAQSKLPFLTAVTMLLVPAETSAPRLLAIVATVMAGAAFGYGLNEVADRASDARALKPNRAAELGRGRWLPYLILTGCGTLGLSVAWAPDPAAPVLVLLSLTLAIAYSLPPLRLKARGRAGLVAAAAAQWTLPVLVVSAAEVDGWQHPSAWVFALLSLAIGTRWMVVHQLQDAARDRRSKVRSYGASRPDASGLLLGLLAAEVVLLGAGLAWSWTRSAPAAIALGPFLARELFFILRSRALLSRLAGYDQAPLARYYFFALPLALGMGMLVTGRGPGAAPPLLLAVAVPQLMVGIRWWRGARPAMNRQSVSTQNPVVRASEPQP